MRKIRTGLRFLLTRSCAVVEGPCLENENQVVNFINAQFIGWHADRGALLGHAAGVRGEHVGIGIAGISGAGKSTLALRLVDAGLRFTSNDRLLIERVIEPAHESSPAPAHESKQHQDGSRYAMTGVPKWPRVNPGTLLEIPRLHRLLPENQWRPLRALPKAELHALEAKVDVDVSEWFGRDRVALQGPMNALVVLRWDWSRNAPTRISRVTLAEAHGVLSAVMKSPGPLCPPPRGEPFDVVRTAQPAMYREVLAEMPIFDVTGGVDMNAAVAFCRGLIAAT